LEFYHGSAVGGLTELRPFANIDSNLPEPLVYLTTLKQLALHYITQCRMLDVRIYLPRRLRDQSRCQFRIVSSWRTFTR